MQETPKLTAAMVRALYPSPCTAKAWKLQGESDEAYCVGGALCMAMGGEHRFPSDYRIFCALHELNPSGDVARQHNAAWAIACHNDLGEFEEAWAELDKVL